MEVENVENAGSLLNEAETCAVAMELPSPNTINYFLLKEDVAVFAKSQLVQENWS